MEIKVLGTAASPSLPLPFCCCGICDTARTIGGRNLRKRSSLTINDEILIDIGPDIISSSFQHSIPLEKIKICLQTHPHADHFDPELIISRHRDYGTQVTHPLTLVGSKKTLQKIDYLIGQQCNYGSIYANEFKDALHINTLEIKAYEPHILLHYKVIGIPALHDLSSDSLLFIVIEKDRSILYATDTSGISDPALEYIKSNNIYFDTVFLDHTYGMGYSTHLNDHLGNNEFINYVNRFIRNGILKSDGVIYATHFSHEGNIDFDKLSAMASKNNYSIAFDGMRLNI